MIVCVLFAGSSQAHSLLDDDELDASGKDALRLLVLYSNERTLPANQDIQQGLWTSLQQSMDLNEIELIEEYLEIHKLARADEQAKVSGYLKLRYSNMEPDIIVVVGPRSIEILRKLLSKVFPDRPLLFAGLWEGQLTDEEVKLWSGGIFYELSVSRVLDLVTRLLPDCQELVLVGGGANFDQFVLPKIRQEIAARVPWGIREIANRSPEEIARELRQLGPRTAVLFTTYFRDDQGHSCVPVKILEQIATEASAPIFAFFDSLFGVGPLGVVASPFEEQGRQIGGIVKRLAAGESIEAIGVQTVPATRLMIDGRYMERYGLDMDQLPSEAEVFFQTPSLFDEHPIFVLLGSAIILIQASLITALLWARHQKQQAEDQAVEMERYFMAVFMGSPNPKAVMRVRERVFKDINPAFEEFFCITREEAVGRSARELGILPVDYDVAFYEDFLKAGRRLVGYELKVQLPSGDLRHVEVFSSQVEVAGEALYLIVVLDASDRIQAQKLRNNLARDNRVAQLGQISVSIAHEINQPLGSILSNAEAALMHLDAQDASNEELREILSEIKSEDRRAAGVVEKIRAMLEGHSEVKAPVVMDEVITEAGRMVKGEARRRGVDLRLPSQDLPSGVILGERVMLVQVLLNLIFNAMDAVEMFPASQRVVTIDRTISLEARELCLSVSDHGPGIPPSEIGELFEFYYSTKQKGMGLGLAISRYIIEDHKGRISVENLEAGGACFYIRLPLIPNDA
jgi:PAS domain S-box-containing protein